MGEVDRICKINSITMQQKNPALDSTIKSLNNNPIFRMSLGSKELFHSNFLEYLWCLDHNHVTFIKLINNYFKGNELVFNKDYVLEREKNNFDICIHHKEDNVLIYDLIIENKVKSIPYKEQLEGYVKKVKDSAKRFMLLTMSDQFPDYDDIKEIWTVVKYDSLEARIREFYLKDNTSLKNTKHQSYISDYCDLVQLLVKLVSEVILPPDLNNVQLFDNEVIKKLKEIRIHDLYIKLRSSWFLLKLKEKLSKDCSPVVVHKYEEIKNNDKYNKSKGVFLNVDINQGNGQIAAWIYDASAPKEKNGNTFEIVIQGNQYRHGISQCFKKKKNSPKLTGDARCNRLNMLYERIENSRSAAQFLGLKDIVFLPAQKGNFRKSTINKDGPFNCYDDSYIYRYITLGEGIKDEISSLLEHMCREVISVYSNIPTFK
jgi:hypothetical protein